MKTLSTHALAGKLVALLGFDRDHAEAIERQIQERFARQSHFDPCWHVPEPVRCPPQSLVEVLEAPTRVCPRTATIVFGRFEFERGGAPAEVVYAPRRLRGFDGAVVWEWSPDDGRPRAAPPPDEDALYGVERELVAGADEGAATLRSARRSLQGE